MDKQQVLHVFGFRISVPLVFDQLDTVKPCQGLFDPVGSGASVQPQPLAHLFDDKRRVLLARRFLLNTLFRRRRLATCEKKRSEARRTNQSCHIDHRCFESTSHTTRKPIKRYVFDVMARNRFAERQARASSSQQPPRTTR